MRGIAALAAESDCVRLAGTATTAPLHDGGYSQQHWTTQVFAGNSCGQPAHLGTGLRAVAYGATRVAEFETSGTRVLSSLFGHTRFPRACMFEHYKLKLKRLGGEHHKKFPRICARRKGPIFPACALKQHDGEE